MPYVVGADSAVRSLVYRHRDPVDADIYIPVCVRTTSAIPSLHFPVPSCLTRILCNCLPRSTQSPLPRCRLRSPVKPMRSAAEGRHRELLSHECERAMASLSRIGVAVPMRRRYRRRTPDSLACMKRATTHFQRNSGSASKYICLSFGWFHRHVSDCA